LSNEEYQTDTKLKTLNIAKYPFIQMDAQAIQKQQVELQNAIRLGDEVQKHTALREEDRTKIRMHVSSLKNQWQSLEERMHKKVKRYM
jgi:ribosomal protein S6